MGKAKKVVNVLWILLILAAVVHTCFYFLTYGLSVPGFGSATLSGFSIGQYDVGNQIIKFNPLGSGISKVILLFEWVLIVSIFLFVYFKSGKKNKIEFAELKKRKEQGRKGMETDLDSLYNLLKEKKSLRISTISKLFELDADTAMDWSRTLESGKLVTIKYPRFGEPEIVVVP